MSYDNLLRPVQAGGVSVIACSIVLFCGASYAQQNTSQREPELLNPIIVTATIEPTPANDVLADHVYVGPEQIERAGQSSLPELLQQQRGVQITSYGGAGNVSSVYLRGTNNNQALVLIDGVRSESSSLGGAVWSSIPMSLIDHIEIVFGPQSTFYGADALGGVIQIFTKRGDGPMQFNASTGYGSYGTSISSVSLSGSTEGEHKTRYAVGINYETSSGFNTVAANNYCSAANAAANYCAPGYPTSATGYTRTGAAGQFSQDWGVGQELGLKFFATRTANKYPGYDYNYALPEIDTQVGGNYSAALYSKNQITNTWSSLLQVSQANTPGQNLTTYTADPISTPETDVLWQNNIKFGSDVAQVLAEHRIQNVSATYSGTTSVNQSRTIDSIAASYQLNRGSHVATAALRNDSMSGYGNQTTGSVAYGYCITEELRANINYGTGFRAPTFNDLYYPGYGNADLKPETNQNFELGLHYETKLYGLHLVGYDNKIDNLIIAMPCQNASSGYCPTNFAKTEISGVSVGANAVFDKLTVRGSFDVMNPLNVLTNLQLPQRANNVFNLGADYRTGPFDFGSTLTWSGVRYADSANTQTLSGYALINLYASYDIDKSWTVFLKWNNILNAQYQFISGYNPPGSNVFVGMRYVLH